MLRIVLSVFWSNRFQRDTEKDNLSLRQAIAEEPVRV